MVLIQLLFACTLSKAPLKAQKDTTLFVVSARDELDTRTASSLPPSLQRAIEKKIRSRGISLTTLPLKEEFSMQRTSAQRQALYEPRPLLLIETKAQFFSQLNGRFRWTVDVQLHLSAQSGTPFVQQFSVPVFHQFHHEREAEALEAAQEVILRHVDILLDDYIRGGTL